MNSVKLKLNPDKTEFIMFGNGVQLRKCLTNSLQVVKDRIEKTNFIQYLGSYLDETLSFRNHVQAKSKAAILNYIKIREIKKFLTRDACTTLVMGLIMSHLDYSNSVLFRSTDTVLNRYQQIQSMSAKLVLGHSKYSSSKQALKEFHWLPIRARTDFKILC